MDEEGNLGYYLYNESTGEEKLFSVVEDERLFARGTGVPKVVTLLPKFKEQGAINKATMFDKPRLDWNKNKFSLEGTVAKY